MPVSELRCESYTCQKAFLTCEACTRTRSYIESVTDAMVHYLRRPGPDWRLAAADPAVAAVGAVDGDVGEELEERIVAVVDAMNALPPESYPSWAADCHQAPVREAAQAFQGQDSKNDAGSALVLLMLRPHLYGYGSGHWRQEQGWVPWWRLGFPPPSSLLTLDQGPIRSGRGPGNHRTNLLEGLIQHWRTFGGSREVHHRIA